MHRRDALRTIGAGVAFTAAPVLGGVVRSVFDFGARRPGQPRPNRKTFHRTFAPFKGVSGTINKNVFLFHNLQKQIGEIVPHDQSTIIEADGTVSQVGEGDCVGHATAMACDILAANNIHMLGLREKWVAKSSVEMIYAGSRVEIGGGVLNGRAGSHGEWAANYVKNYGVLHRTQYRVVPNALDLSGYDPDRSRQYRNVGVPDWLEPIARQHPVREITNVQSGREALDAVCAGQPVLMCSSYAFKNTRDADGFCEAHLGTGRLGGLFDGRWGRLIQWWHAMVLTGAILEGPRVGGVIQNSHGAWNSGPQPYGMPDGSFGVDLDVLDKMVTDWFDCYALSSYKGHSAKRIRHKLY